MKKLLVGILILASLATWGMFHAIMSVPSRPVSEQQIKNYIDYHRVSKGLSQLAYDPILEREAQERAERLCHIPFDHTEYNQEILTSGYVYSEAGENLAQSDGWSNEQIVQAWYDSPTHYANIMKREYKETGIGVAECNNRTIIVQWFGTKK
jgi:uncharacterized protein YkwD